MLCLQAGQFASQNGAFRELDSQVCRPCRGTARSSPFTFMDYPLAAFSLTTSRTEYTVRGSVNFRRSRPMRMLFPRILVGSLLLFPLSSFRTLVAQMQSTTSPHAVDGIVVDKGRAPVPSAELELKRQGEQSRVARSGEDGRFAFPDVQTGSVALTVRRMGYTARTITIDVSPAGVAAPVEVELEEIPSDIASVIVESSKQHLEEFYQRKATNSFGKFF